MTNISINQIKITGSQIWVTMNNNDNCFGLFEAATLLSFIEEKSIKIISREYHKHNDYTEFKNSFMFKIHKILDIANYNKNNPRDYIYDVPFWLIDQIDYKPNGISVIIRNIKGENIKDD